MRDPEEATVLADCSQSQLRVGGHAFIADRFGALFWATERTLLVADMHFEKGSAFARRGWMLPPYDTRETLARLSAAIAAFRPETVIALGDSLHDPDGGTRIDTGDLKSLASLQKNRRWIWITGNHDPQIANAFGGEILPELMMAGIRFVHEPSAKPPGPEIAGHLHPAAKLISKGVAIRRPCFVGDVNRLIMPAFGAFTGGLNIFDSAFTGLFSSESIQVHMLGKDGVYSVPITKLTGD